MRDRRKEQTSTRRVVLALLVLGLVLGVAPTASAVSAQGKVSIQLSVPGAMQPSTYTIGRFRTANRETVTGYTITFPSDTVVAGVTSPGNTVQYLGGTTVRVTLGTAIAGNTTFSIVLDNVVNPTTPGTYTITQAIFHRGAGGDQTVTWPANQGTYTILASPYLIMTITTPDPDQSVEFGAIDPGVSTAPRQVLVDVTSSAPFTITRTLGGDTTAIGLNVTGTANGTGPAGASSFADELTLTPPWTTDPGTPLVATITYTVVQ